LFGLGAEEKIRVNDIMAARETALHLVEGSRAMRALRADPERLRPPLHLLHHPVRARKLAFGSDGEVVAQVRRLTEKPLPRVVLTGVDITSYGTNLPGHPRLGKLVRQILRHVPELERLRISSIDSVEADADLLGRARRGPR